MIDEIVSHFKKSDPLLADLYIAATSGDTPITTPVGRRPEEYAEALFSSIVSQQLSTKAAATIWKRFCELVKNPRDPHAVLLHDEESLRTVGLSRQKSRYILAIAEGTSNGTVRLDHLAELDNEAVIDELVQLKGVGRWTAEMFLMFTLGRPDVFSIGDLGLRNAANKLYGSELSLTDLIEKSQRWSPYRTAASLALWHSLDNTPTSDAARSREK